jgi:hypothetical protein
MSTTQLTPEQKSVYDAATNRSTTPMTNADPNNPENLPVFDRINKTIAVLQTPEGQTPEYQAKAEKLLQRVTAVEPFANAGTGSVISKLMNYARRYASMPGRKIKTLYALEHEVVPSYDHRQASPTIFEKLSYIVGGKRNEDAYKGKGTKYGY